jgi:HEAT repeat protein
MTMKRLMWLILVIAAPINPAWGYVDATPSLGKVLNDANTIVVLRVEKLNTEKRIIIYQKVGDLKGTHPTDEVKHQITDGFHPREPRTILDWAEPGKLAVCFHDGKTAITCIGQYWYECATLEAPWWTMTSARPELSLAYFGPAEKLRDSIPALLDEKEVVVTAVMHGARSDVWQHGNVAFRKVLRGKDCPIWRIKASLKMPDNAMEVGSKDSKWIVGPGVAAPEDVPGLTRKLDDKEAAVRGSAADDLGLIGRPARSAAPTLAKLLEDPEPLIRIRAATAVALIGEDASAGVTTLQEALHSKKVAVRKAAAQALGDVGSLAKPTVPILTEALHDPDATVRWTAAEALGRIGGDAEAAVPELAQALRDKSIRTMAADALGAIGPPARGAVPLLHDALKDADANYRWTAAIALTRIDSKSAKAALPLLIEKLKSSDARARWDAMMFISPMGLDAKDAAAAVLKMVKDGDGVAATVLATISGPDASEAIPLLVQVLADDWDTSDSLALIGPAAVPELLKALQKKDGKRTLVVKALGLIAPKAKEAIPPLLDAVKDQDKDVRIAAINALAGIDPKVKEAVTALTKALGEEDVEVRLAAVQALLAIQGAEAKEPIAALRDLLSHKESSARRDAASALGDLGVAAKGILPDLAHLLKDPDGGVRSAAAYAVARIKSAEAVRASVEIMLPGLGDKEVRVRQEAARFLGQLGPDAKAAIPALTKALRDEDEEVSKAAIEALGKIQAK